MTVYLGTLGRMIPIYTTPSAQLETEERYSFSTTLEGSRKAQVRPVGRRTWGLNAQFADPAEHSLLSQFADGAWGHGPFVFVSADAPVSNMLTPDGAGCRMVASAGNQLGGPVMCSDGTWSATSMIVGAGPYIGFQIDRSAVIGGGSVFVCAEVMGVGGRVGVSFFDASGAFISVVRSPAVGVDGLMRRAALLIDAPVTAVSASVTVSDAVLAARPRLAWSDRVLPWSDGQGCSKAVVHGLSRDQVLAVQGHTYSNVSFTVSEVG